MTLARWKRSSPAPLLILLTLLAAGVPAARQSADAGKPVTVYLVRHAEKQEPASNPDTETPLNAEGRARAQELAKLLSGCGIRAAYATQYRRTQDTAKPLLERSKIQSAPVIIHSDHTADIPERIRVARETAVLVAGHSNTTAEVTRLLAGRSDAAPDIAHETYHDLFVVTVLRWQPREATVKHFRFGKKSPGSESSTLPEFAGCGK